MQIYVKDPKNRKKNLHINLNCSYIYDMPKAETIEFELELINYLDLKIMIHFQRKNSQRLTALDKVWK